MTQEEMYTGLLLLVALPYESVKAEISNIREILDAASSLDYTEYIVMGAVYIWEENEFLYQFLIKNDGLDIFYMREEFVRTFYTLRYDVALHIAKNPHLFNNEFFATAEKERAHLFLENDYHENN